MLCFNCDKGELEKKNTILSMDLVEKIIVIKKVPAEVCELCGAEYIEPPVDTLIKKMVRKIKTEPTITGDVILDYTKEADEIEHHERNERRIKNYSAYVKATFAFEGRELSPEIIELGERILREEITGDQARDIIAKKYNLDQYKNIPGED